MKKKRIIILLVYSIVVIAIILSILIVNCQGKGTITPPSSAESTNVNPNSNEVLPVSNEVISSYEPIEIATVYDTAISDFGLGESQSEIINKLSDWDYTTEQDEYWGYSITVSDIELNFLSDNLACIGTSSAEVSTLAGIKVGDTAEKVIQFYGENFIYDESYIYAGSLTYFDGQTYICFNFDANEMKSNMSRKVISWSIQNREHYEKFCGTDSEF